MTDVKAPAVGPLIRDAMGADVTAIASIERDSFTQPWSRASFADLVGASGVAFLVAQAADGRVVGYAVLIVSDEDCELANVAVARDARGQGIGRRLLGASLDHARARRALRVFLEVRESNRAAQSLYASSGFRVIARRRRYYDQPSEDALVLRLDL